MPKYKISLSLADLPIRRAHIDAVATALKPGYTKITEFDHGVDLDTLPRASVSHVLYHHVQDALYFVKDGQSPIEVGFFPDNITDMASVVISLDETLPPVVPTSVTVAPATVNLVVGATQQLTPTVLPADATDKSVTYVSSTPATATVNAAGLVTAVAAGTTNITVTTVSGARTVVRLVTVTAA